MSCKENVRGWREVYLFKKWAHEEIMMVNDFWFILEAVLGLCTRYPGCTVCTHKADDDSYS